MQRSFLTYVFYSQGKRANLLERASLALINGLQGKGSCSVVFFPQRPHGLQPSRLLPPWDFPDKSTGVGCHCLLRPISSNSELLPFTSTCSLLLFFVCLFVCLFLSEVGQLSWALYFQQHVASYFLLEFLAVNSNHGLYKYSEIIKHPL